MRISSKISKRCADLTIKKPVLATKSPFTTIQIEVCLGCLREKNSRDDVYSSFTVGTELKGINAWDSSEVFRPKSKPYMILVNIRKKFRLFSFDFCHNFDVRTFSRYKSIRRTNFLLRGIWNFSSSNVLFGPIRWDPWRLFEMSIIYCKKSAF